MNDALSRIGSIIDDDASSTHLAAYSYLGLGPARGLLPTVNSPFTLGAIEVDYTEPDIRWTLIEDCRLFGDGSAANRESRRDDNMNGGDQGTPEP